MLSNFTSVIITFIINSHLQWKLQNPVWVLQAFFGRNLQFTGFCSAVLMTAYQITDFQSAVICSLPVFAVPEFEVSTVLPNDFLHIFDCATLRLVHVVIFMGICLVSKRNNV